jgi:regulator of protease activity HflC (stomatin/prohibitin superfamily)
MTYLLVFLVLLALLVIMGFKVLPEYERAVIFRFGRLARGVLGGNGPGVVIIIPFVDDLQRVSLRTVAMDVPSQDIITKDNVTVKVNAVIYFRVVEPQKAIVAVEDYLYATSMIAQTTLPSATRSMPSFNALSIHRRSPGGSRSRPLRSRTSTSLRRCNGPSRSRPRPNGTGVRKSSTPKGSFRRRSAWPKPRT